MSNRSLIPLSSDDDDNISDVDKGFKSIIPAFQTPLPSSLPRTISREGIVSNMIDVWNRRLAIGSDCKISGTPSLKRLPRNNVKQKVEHISQQSPSDKAKRRVDGKTRSYSSRLQEKASTDIHDTSPSSCKEGINEVQIEKSMTDCRSKSLYDHKEILDEEISTLLDIIRPNQEASADCKQEISIQMMPAAQYRDDDYLHNGSVPSSGQVSPIDVPAPLRIGHPELHYERPVAHNQETHPSSSESIETSCTLEYRSTLSGSKSSPALRNKAHSPFSSADDNNNGSTAPPAFIQANDLLSHLKRHESIRLYEEIEHMTDRSMPPPPPPKTRIRPSSDHSDHYKYTNSYGSTAKTLSSQHTGGSSISVRSQLSPYQQSQEQLRFLDPTTSINIQKTRSNAIEIRREDVSAEIRVGKRVVSDGNWRKTSGRIAGGRIESEVKSNPVHSIRSTVSRGRISSDAYEIMDDNHPSDTVTSSDIVTNGPSCNRQSMIGLQEEDLSDSFGRQGSVRRFSRDIQRPVPSFNDYVISDTVSHVSKPSRQPSFPPFANRQLSKRSIINFFSPSSPIVASKSRSKDAAIEGTRRSFSFGRKTSSGSEVSRYDGSGSMIPKLKGSSLWKRDMSKVNTGHDRTADMDVEQSDYARWDLF